MLIEDHFRSLYRSVRFSTPESVHEGLNILDYFDQAKVLDEINSEFNVSTQLAKIMDQLTQFVESKHRRFATLLRNYQFPEAYAILTQLEEYTHRGASLEPLQRIKGFKGIFRAAFVFEWY